ncbi:hypothetical protein MUK70_19155 [Dyadobacter chenwenxiniae]|uniref:Uncharacterized protein n=1 Tax=Dyadobacter chenwenxiniae TaxID=2906456 RepID=A0A9X1TEC9_9BACT|nr:hypothetical protein [Dyadobacter chenwenxiniae]MCF0061360.1 hypothetical protein [Dyadobacter chenwenxiniae]UON81182.1 hypothetical protein MUK70_19155 [Dyadobacter chenwenxiniae]
MSFFEKFAKAASDLGSYIIKTTAKTIDFIYDTTVQIAGRIADASRRALKSIGKDIETIIEVTADVAKTTIRKVSEIAREIKNGFNNIFTSQQKSEAQYGTQVRYAGEIFEIAKELLERAEEAHSNAARQNFRDFARLSASSMFLEDLLKRQHFDSAQTINTRFVGSIWKFLDNEFDGDNAAIEDFDRQISQIYKKGLLEIGSEILVNFWKSQEGELKSKLDSQVLRFNNLEREIGKLESRKERNLDDVVALDEEIGTKRDELRDLKWEEQQLRREYLDNKDMAGVSRSMLFVMKYQYKLPTYLIELGTTAGEIITRWKRNILPSVEERELIRTFSLAAEGERRTFYTSGPQVEL